MRVTFPSVSVIIAARDAGATIARAIDSALSQPECAEVIVVDDASRDDCAARARACRDRGGRLQVIGLDRNVGPAAARNIAIAAASAPWLAPLDADDYMDQGRLRRLLAHAKGWDFVADDLYVVRENDPDGRRERLWSDAPFRPRPVDLALFIEQNLPRPERPYREMGFLKPLMSRAFLDEARIGYDGRMRLGEDFDLYARALAAGAKFLLIDPQGYVAMRREGSLSARHSAADLAHLVLGVESLRRRYGLSPAARRALAAMRRAINSKWAWQRLIEAVHARDGGGCAQAVLQGPAETAFVGEKLAAEAWRRWGRPAQEVVAAQLAGALERAR